MTLQAQINDLKERFVEL